MPNYLNVEILKKNLELLYFVGQKHHFLNPKTPLAELFSQATLRHITGGGYN
jgi:hypothetical protein